MKRIAFTAPKTAELVEISESSAPLASQELRGRTLVSLVSPGTELNSGFLGQSFPSYPGYACVFQVEEVGAEVANVKSGDIVYFAGGHAEFQRAWSTTVVPLPAGLAPETAVFARLMGVTMSTLNTTTARPPSPVLVTGLGPVGNLAAQIFARCGYSVTAVDPVAARRETAAACGLKDVRASIEDGPDVVGKIALHLECSGHEAAALAGCRAIRQRGEVVQVGTPWVKRTDLSAHELLSAIFHKYAVVRSGWEWEVPEQFTPFTPNHRMENYAAALRWLSEGSVRVESLAAKFRPDEAQAVYDGLLTQSLPAPGAVFDWR